MKRGARRWEDVDVAVLGGGPAGCATALALRRREVGRVLVVEASRYEAVRVGESIPPDTALLLRELGLWQAFLAEGHEPCLGSCSSWGHDDLGYNDFLFNPHGHGWHLDRRRFDAFLARAAGAAGAEVRTATRFLGAEGDGEGSFCLRLAAAGEDRVGRGHGEARDEVRARFVVDATGSGARFARRRGARRRFHDRLICAVAFFELPSEAHFSRLTFLEAVADGWWYAAKLPGGRLAVAFASDSEILKALGMTTEEGFLTHLQATRHLATELADASWIAGSPRISVAASSCLDRAVGNAWLAVGDAASTYDPISSQGVYKALAGALRAAPAITARLAGDHSGMGEYQRSITGQFADYLANRNYFYGLEQRFAASAFWNRRCRRTSLAQNPSP